MRMLIRALVFFVALAILIGVVSWFADRPGQVELTWLGYRVDAGVHVILIGILVIAAVLVVLHRLWWGLMRVAPGMGRFWRESKRRKGYAALTDGLVAVAAGDTSEAAKLAAKAENILDNPPLTLLLSAQAAQMSGDNEKARGYFRQMLDRPETAFLGLRGLITYALNEGDIERARLLSRKAYALKQSSDWLSGIYYDLLVRNGDWVEAETVTKASERHKLITVEQAAWRQTILTHERSLDAEQSGNRDEAIKLARKAADGMLKFSPGVVNAARLMTAAGKQRRSLTLVEKAWAVNPHPSLVDVYADAAGAADAMERVRAMDKLASCNKGHRESQIAMGEAALEAGLWGEARSKLQPVLESGGDIRAYRMMARIEESENQDLAAAHKWLLLAAEAPAPETWVCSGCGAAAADWRHICGNCDAIESFRWMRPPQLGAIPAMIGASEPEVLLPALTDGAASSVAKQSG